jgi:hypothetical protein
MTAMVGHETSDEIEREAEISRARLALTLDQLRDNLTPRHLADEMLGHAKEGASVVLDTLGASTAKHPVPALLISAACAALLSLATGPARQRHRDDLPAPPIPYAASEPARRSATTRRRRGPVAGRSSASGRSPPRCSAWRSVAGSPPRCRAPDRAAPVG